MKDVYQENKQILQSTIAETIKEKRLCKNKTISLISNEIGMTKSMWADLEKKIKDPQISTLWRISEGLDTPLSNIIKEIEDKVGNKFSLIEI